MTDLSVVKTQRDARSESAVRILEHMLERARNEGCSQLCVFFSPANAATWVSDGVSEDMQQQLGALESMKWDLLRESFRDG